MPWSRLFFLRRWILAGCAALAAGSVAAQAGAGSSGGSAPPAFVAQALPDAALAGEGVMRFFGLRIYDARLWVGPWFDADAFSAHPLALELTYHRAFAGAAIAQRSMEEIERQRSLAPAAAERWRQALAALLPDVQAGDRLTGIYRPGKGMSLWNGHRELGAIDDAQLAQSFFGIWLSPSTSEPGLRKALLGQAGRSAP